MKFLISTLLLTSVLACSHTTPKTSVRGIASDETPAPVKCEPNSFQFGGRDPGGETAQESAEKEFNPRLTEFLNDCDVQKEVAAVAQNNSIEVRGFVIDGLMAQLIFDVQDYSKHTKISCKLDAGEGMDDARTPHGPGPISTVAYMKKIVKKAVCSKPVRS